VALVRLAHGGDRPAVFARGEPVENLRADRAPALTPVSGSAAARLAVTTSTVRAPMLLACAMPSISRV